MKNDVNPLPHLITDKSYSEIFGNIGSSAKDILQNDVSLVLTELKQIKNKITGESYKALIYGFVLYLSAFPLMAFAILGLGKYLDGKYWLSSFIVGSVLLFISAIGLSTTFKKVKSIDVDLKKTKAVLKKEGEVFQDQLSKIQFAMKGDGHAH
jgi:uncharacterized membrane protein YqjE